MGHTGWLVIPSRDGLKFLAFFLLTSWPVLTHF